MISLPATLPADPKRQAVPLIRSMVYQAYCSIEAWLQLIDDGTVIYVEGAEDFDVTSDGDAIAVQVKNTGAPISLNSSNARDALENYWILAEAAAPRAIGFHYLTTSGIARERDFPVPD